MQHYLSNNDHSHRRESKQTCCAVFNAGIDALSVSALTCARTAFSLDGERKVTS